MPILNPDHLFQQADKLIAAPPAGPPRQVDLRRAISSAYYAVFHAIVTAGADEFVGKTNRSKREYALVYRRVDHGALRDLCRETRKTQGTGKYARFWPSDGFESHIRAFSEAVVGLQEKRHAADYDPLFRAKTVDAKLAISTGREAVRQLEDARVAQRKSFLTLLLFPPR